MRLPLGLDQAVADAAKVAGVHRSTWVRQAIETALATQSDQDDSHRIAVTQICIHPPARELFDRRRAQRADTKAGALRVLKRHLADVVFHAMNEDQRRRKNGTPTLQPIAA
ncbi:MAG TPA: hypothetical protein VFZ72_10000 [Jiangellaceae bacterium]